MRSQASALSTLPYRVALLGNPNEYPEWSEERLRQLKDLGFNMIQLNIAWLSRPHDEALNLRDVVTPSGEQESTSTAKRREDLKRRNAMAKKLGFRTMFHFGSPFMWRNPDTGEIKIQKPDAWNANPPWFDTENPKLVEYETGLLRQFVKEFPDVDDILIYTYDQDAWQASEFSHSSLSRGKPLHQRLPKYLQALHEAFVKARSGSDHILWWEPWELSAGQVYKCILQLPATQFGLMLHSNIAEVQISMPVDVWFRNTARMCAERGIPVVAEGFLGSATEEIQPLSFPFPRLVDEQVVAMTSVKGVCGLKEYFGIIPGIGDLNLEMVAARIHDKTGATSEELLSEITKRFGAAQPQVIELCNALSDAMQLWPWDVSWYARLAGTANIDHGWNAAAIRGQQVETPSWESTRRAHFMKTDDQRPHPFLLEDVQLRLHMAMRPLARASEICEQLERSIKEEPEVKRLAQIRSDVRKFLVITRSYVLHIRETNVAALLRGDLESSRPLTPHLIIEMKELLRADAINQADKGVVMERIRQFDADPAGFVKQWLLPLDKDIRERGIFTLTTR